MTTRREFLGGLLAGVAGGIAASLGIKVPKSRENGLLAEGIDWTAVPLPEYESGLERIGPGIDCGFDWQADPGVLQYDSPDPSVYPSPYSLMPTERAETYLWIENPGPIRYLKIKLGDDNFYIECYDEERNAWRELDT